MKFQGKSKILAVSTALAVWVFHPVHADPVKDGIECLQAQLNELGENVGAVDGAFGRKTNKNKMLFKQASIPLLKSRTTLTCLERTVKMKASIRAISILIASHLGSSAIAEERSVLYFVEDSQLQNYIDSVESILASASRSPSRTAVERIIFFSGAGAINNNQIDVSRMWFLGAETADYYQKLDTKNGNCFLQLHDGPSKIRVLIAVNDTSGGVTYQDKQCYLLTLATSYGVNMDDFPNLTEAGMLVELIRFVEGTI